MNMIVRPFALVLFAAVPLVAGAQVQGHNGVGATGSQGGNAVVHSGNTHGFGLVAPDTVVGGCGVTDLPTFERFIASKPTPAGFRAAYSCVHLALPGDITTREFRSDNSRYFADLDAHGRIVGGQFQ